MQNIIYGQTLIEFIQLNCVLCLLHFALRFLNHTCEGTTSLTIWIKGNKLITIVCLRLVVTLYMFKHWYNVLASLLWRFSWKLLVAYLHPFLTQMSTLSQLFTGVDVRILVLQKQFLKGIKLLLCEDGAVSPHASLNLPQLQHVRTVFNHMCLSIPLFDPGERASWNTAQSRAEVSNRMLLG